MRVILMTALLCVLLLSCSGSKGNPVTPSEGGQVPGTALTAQSQEGRVSLGFYWLNIDFGQQKAWIESLEEGGRSAAVSHSNVTNYMTSGNCGYYPNSSCLILAAEFISGDGHKLDVWNCFRLEVTIRNELHYIPDQWGVNIAAPDLYDLRWIIDRDYLDLANLAFVSPNGYTRLYSGEDTARHPYRTFCLDDPERMLAHGEDTDPAHMLFMIGEDPQYTWEGVDDIQPPDAQDGVVKLLTIIDCALQDQQNQGAFHTEEPVGIFLGVDEENRLIFRVTDEEFEVVNPSNVYEITDWQANWEDIVEYVDTSYDTVPGFFVAPGFWWDPVGNTRKVTVEYIFPPEENRLGGLYEIPIWFIDQSITPDYIPPIVRTDRIGYMQYAYQQRQPRELTGGIPWPMTWTPAATSPMLIDLDGDGDDPDCITVFRNRQVVCANKDGINWVRQFPPPQYTLRSDYCVGTPAFSNQNDEETLDVIVGTWMTWNHINPPYPSLSQGRVFCFDGTDGDTIWTRDFAVNANYGYGDVVASPIVAELDGENSCEEVIILLHQVPEGQPEIRVLQYNSGSEPDELFTIDIPDADTSAMRANGALTYSGSDLELISCYRHDEGGDRLITVDLAAQEIIDESADLDDQAVDIFEMNIVHLGPVVGDIDNDGNFNVIVPRLHSLLIFDQNLDLFDSVDYEDIDADQSEDLFTTLGSESESLAECHNRGSLPALGDLNHNGIPDMVFGLQGWVVALSYVTDGPSANRLDSIWTWHDPDGRFSSHPALADMTRDGFLDVVIGAGNTVEPQPGETGPYHNLLALDGSPLNLHCFGVPSQRPLWRLWYPGGVLNPNEPYRAVSQGPAVANGQDGDTDDRLLVGMSWTMTSMPYKTTWAYFNTRYEGHGVKEAYPPPPMWQRYLADRYCSACYDFDPQW